MEATGPQTEDHDIGSTLTIYITLGAPAPPDDLYQLLVAAKTQVRDRAALFGPTARVPHRKASPDLTQTTYGGLEYFIEPGRVLNPRHPGLEWGEFQAATFWLYDYLWTSSPLNRRACSFVLYRKGTGGGLNLGFGEIKPLEAAEAESQSSNGVDTS